MEVVDGVAAGAVVTVALGAFQVLKMYAPKIGRNGHSNNNEKIDISKLPTADQCTANGNKIEAIHEWYGVKGPMDRMTTQMEDMSASTKEHTGVLRMIHKELRKD